MKPLAPKAWALWGLLANAQAQHVKDLSAALACEVPQLNALAQQLPESVQKALRQKDGWWQLKHAMAVLSPLQAQYLVGTTGWDVAVVQQTASSNDVLWERHQQGQDIHQQVVVALEQTQGRGRMSRAWQGVQGRTLMFSVAYRLPSVSNNVASLPLLVGLLLQQALAAQNVKVQLKWPNDLMVGQEKLGGILVESKYRGQQAHVVIGMGINVLLPEDVSLSVQAASCQQQQAHFDVALFLETFLQSLQPAIERLLEHSFVVFQDAYLAHMRDMGKMVTLYERGEFLANGMVVGVDTLGALQLQNAQGQIQTHLDGEISLRSDAPDALMDEKNKHSGTNLHSDSQQYKSQQMVLAANKHTIRYILLDGGNSQLKWAWVDQEQQLHFAGRAPYANLQAFAEFISQQAQEIAIIGCAVCGHKKMSLVEQAASGRPIRWLSSMRHALDITNHYYKVQQHGSDRWFNVLGSRLFTQNSCVVVSCGTAITIDALTHDGHYLGGSIMPGFNLMKEAMAVKTANLNQPIGKAYPFATSTSNALASGMQDAAAGAVVLMQRRLHERQQGAAVDIVLTGGGAAKIQQHLPKALILDSQVQIVDNLVLFGLKNWVEHTCNY